ncbi:hypothetical protein EVAR_52961_1 [Eumeta japonica]|uniref:Uncharacterized protein n=1 Tax=Eumeta variegata TaxID=151549 RepID=A0A4C1YYE4_EUMVA|nr:hypothetical protein EVAR_52961_1 [Eumeta japonica]
MPGVLELPTDAPACTFHDIRPCNDLTTITVKNVVYIVRPSWAKGVRCHYRAWLSRVGDRSGVDLHFIEIGASPIASTNPRNQFEQSLPYKPKSTRATISGMQTEGI